MASSISEIASEIAGRDATRKSPCVAGGSRFIRAEIAKRDSATVEQKATGLIGSIQGRPQCHSQPHPKQANRFRPGHMTLAVKRTKPKMDLTPRRKPYGAPPKTRLVPVIPTMSRRRPYLTGPAKRRRSERNKGQTGDLTNCAIPPWHIPRTALVAPRHWGRFFVRCPHRHPG
jgi:hypothetical protein